MHYSFIRYFRNSKQVQEEHNNHHTYATHMNTRIFRWKPNSGENHHYHCFSLQNLLLRKLLTIMYWCRLKPARRHPPAEGYYLLSFTSLSWKGATTPCSCLPASPGRGLQPLTEGFDPQHHCRPRFINFQTGSKQLQHNPSLINNHTLLIASNRTVRSL